MRHACDKAEFNKLNQCQKQFPKLYVVGSIPIARSRFFKRFWTVSVISTGGEREQIGKFRDQNGSLATKSPELRSRDVQE